MALYLQNDGKTLSVFFNQLFYSCVTEVKNGSVNYLGKKFLRCCFALSFKLDFLLQIS